MGPLHSGPAAITYAARHPERVSHLILWCTYARGSDYSSVPQVQAIRALMDKDWDVYTETVAHVGFGWSAGEDARQFAGFIRGSVSQQAVQAFRDAIDEYDVTDLLARVTSPTLVLHRRRFELPSVDVARRLTARIPEAQLVLLDGASAAPFLEDAEAVLRAISDFLGMDLEPARYLVVGSKHLLRPSVAAALREGGGALDVRKENCHRRLALVFGGPRRLQLHPQEIAHRLQHRLSVLQERRRRRSIQKDQSRLRYPSGQTPGDVNTGELKLTAVQHQRR